RILGLPWFATRTQDGLNGVVLLGLVLPHQDQRRRAMARNVCPRGVGYESEVLLRQILLNELGAEFTFHEGIGGDLAGPPGGLVSTPRLRESEEPFHEGDSELVLPMR